MTFCKERDLNKVKQLEIVVAQNNIFGRDDEALYNIILLVLFVYGLKKAAGRKNLFLLCEMSYLSASFVFVDTSLSLSFHRIPILK